MADQEQVESVSEEELFYSGIDGKGSKVASEPEPKGTEVPAAMSELEKATRERDEFGRFKAKDTQESPAEAEPPKQESKPAEAAAQEPASAALQSQPAKDDDADGKIPSWRMREIREARDAERARAERAEQQAREAQTAAQQFQRAFQDLQRQLHALQNPPRKPDPINLFEEQGPERFVGTIEERLSALQGEFQKQLRQLRLENNLTVTAMVHKDEFPKAYEAFVAAVEGGDRALATRVFGSTDPGGAMVAWHKEQSTLREIGTDPNAYVQKKLDEALKDPVFLAKAFEKDPVFLAKALEAAKAHASGVQPPAASAQPQAQPAARPNTVTQLPPSLRSMPGTAAASDGSGLQHMSEEELFYSGLRR